ncbi:hypothetical protein MBH78_00605 [Oceanimonas sp. NS1]|nr:hypothetical protein [Oceanimonas sp. NS1]
MTRREPWSSKGFTRHTNDKRNGWRTRQRMPAPLNRWREWIDKKSPGWTPYYQRQVERFMAADVFPYIGKLPIRNVAAAHLLEIIRRVEERGAETVALLIRQWSSAIFRYAVATLRADHDPAAALKAQFIGLRWNTVNPSLESRLSSSSRHWTSMVVTEPQ